MKLGQHEARLRTHQEATLIMTVLVLVSCESRYEIALVMFTQCEEMLLRNSTDLSELLLLL